MRQRSFEIIRVPELEGSSFLYNNVQVYYVATCPETGISFYCSTRTNYGVRVYPDGKKMLSNPSATTSENSKYKDNAKRKQRYLQFKNAFGEDKGLCVSHAVWMAAGRTIQQGYTMDHINGCTTNNSLQNLRCISKEKNVRDGGYLRKLRNKGFNPCKMPNWLLLRYFSRMAEIKKEISKYRYSNLKYEDLRCILISEDFNLAHFLKTYLNINTASSTCAKSKSLCQTTLKNCAD